MMKKLLLARQAPHVEVAAPAAPAGAADLTAAIRSIGQQASTIGREAAEVRGLLDDTTKTSERSAQGVAALADQVRSVTRAQDGIANVSNTSLEAVERVRGAVDGRSEERRGGQ